MTLRQGRWAVLIGLAALAAAGLAVVGGRGSQAPESKPELMLLTSLPLMFGEQFGLEAGGSLALEALQKHYRVRPISVTDAATLNQGQLLLMAHPLAQPAEMLVDLDEWVRGGGRVLLLADPMLEWPSERPLGDALRPPPAFADTGLLGHWGLRLDAPDERGPKAQKLGGKEVLTNSPGKLSGSCDIERGGLVAHCRIGSGYATVVADADFLNTEDLDGPDSDNLNALTGELAALAQKRFPESPYKQTYPQLGIGEQG